MIPEHIIDRLSEAAEEVLAAMFYVFAAPTDENDQELDLSDGALCCRISFTGPQKGALSIVVPNDAGRTLAANFMGLEQDEIEEAMVLDALKELTNMIGGRFLVLVEPEKSFDMGLPEMRSCIADEADRIAAQAGASLVFESDEGMFAFYLNLEDAI